jgi:CheY-like chemotaxis protein
MNKKVSILVVESFEGNIFTALETLELPGEKNEILLMRDAETAIAYLNKQGDYSKAITPDLIFIDLKLAKVNGIELLSYIKKDKKIRAVPVVVFSSSWSEKEVVDCYQNHANCIITKPVNFEKFLEVISGIKDFWINIAQLPKIKDE